jgi:hypothetical protein
MPSRVIKKSNHFCKYDTDKGCAIFEGPCSAKLLGMQLPDCKGFVEDKWGPARRLVRGRKVA